MLEADLIPAFLDTLEDASKSAARQLRGRYGYLGTESAGWANVIRFKRMADFETTSDDERAGFMLETLFNVLNDRAPAGCSFGASEGDGSDYGFWENGPGDDDWYLVERGGKLEIRDSGRDVLIETTWEHLRRDVRREMKRQGYFPDVWTYSDHGNVSRVEYWRK